MLLKAVVFSTFFLSFYGHERKFPPGFKFGAATSAYQVEGAWNSSDKTESIWDRYTHEHSDAFVGGNADVACDSYHLWREDVKMAKELGLHFYRFSISWNRILPSGFPTVVSQAGKKYYSDLIDGLLEAGIEPLVTLYHFDLPQKLQNLGGWTNPHITDWFADYADVVFSLYADRVKTWLTINEPNLICEATYTMGLIAPGTPETQVAPYLCNKYMLIAHAKTWRIYDTKYKPKYHGKVSFAHFAIWMEPFSPEDKNLTELALQHCTGRYAHPVYSKKGGWPPAVEKVMAEYSKKQGHVRSRLPPFTEEEIHLVRGTYDFFALNIYTSRVVRSSRHDDGPRLWFLTGSAELNVTLVTDPHWTVGDISILPIHPAGIRRQIAWLREQYGKDLPILITENGYGSYERDLDDEKRIEYVTKHLDQVLLSIQKDGANVLGYNVWSLMDNFEWIGGFRSRYGLFDVDFEDPKRKRTPRASAHFYANLIKTRQLDKVNHKRTISHKSHSHKPGNSNAAHSYYNEKITWLCMIIIITELFNWLSILGITYVIKAN